jgi:hypothetical protein
MDSAKGCVAGLESAGANPAMLPSALSSSGSRSPRDGEESGSLQPGNRVEKDESTELQEIAAAMI